MLDWISPGWVRDHYGIGAGASSNGAWAAGSAVGTVLSTVIGGMVSAVCKPAPIVKAAKLLLSAKTAAETVDLIGKVASGTASWGDFMSLTLQSLGIVFGKLNAKCFVAGTQVLVGYDDQGQPITRNIEDLREGDFVLAIDENNPEGWLVLRQVTKVWIKTTFGLLMVNIENDAGETTQLKTTDEHPFFVKGAGWVRAVDLKPGDRLLQPDGAFATVTGTVSEQHEAGLTVYNLEVEGAHTYFVDDATSGAMVWVHTANAYALSKNLTSRGHLKAPGAAAGHIVTRGAFSNRKKTSKMRLRTRKTF